MDSRPQLPPITTHFAEFFPKDKPPSAIITPPEDAQFQTRPLKRKRSDPEPFSGSGRSITEHEIAAGGGGPRMYRPGVADEPERKKFAPYPARDQDQRPWTSEGGEQLRPRYRPHTPPRRNSTFDDGSSHSDSRRAHVEADQTQYPRKLQPDWLSNVREPSAQDAKVLPPLSHSTSPPDTGTDDRSRNSLRPAYAMQPTPVEPKASYSGTRVVDQPDSIFTGRTRAGEVGKPVFEPGKPSYDSERPTYDSTKASHETGRPVYESVKPPYEPGRPTYEPGKPPYDPGRQAYESARALHEPGLPKYEPEKLPYEFGRPVHESGKPPYEPGRLTYDPEKRAYESARRPYESARPAYEAGRPTHDPGTLHPYGNPASIAGVSHMRPEEIRHPGASGHHYPIDPIKSPTGAAPPPRGPLMLHTTPPHQPRRQSYVAPLGYATSPNDSSPVSAQLPPGSPHRYTWDAQGLYEQSHRKRRGNLPKESTALLTDWFNKHAAYPYPKEAEKQELQLRTGLAMSQISNWFVNARRRRRPSITTRVEHPHPPPPPPAPPRDREPLHTARYL